MINSDDKVKILTFPALSNVTGGSLLWGDFDDAYKGFTCWTLDEANTYNSLAQPALSQSSTPGSSSASSTGAASPTTSTK